MNIIVYLFFLSLFFANYLSKGLHLVPTIVSWTPEFLALLLMPIVGLLFADKKRLYIGKKYILLLFLSIVFMGIGIFLNSVPLTVAFKGVRTHLKYIPFLLLPAVYNFSEQDLKKQLRFLMPLLLLQVPITLFQRLIQFKGHLSGDPMSGTIGISSFLSITMLCTIAILFVFFLQQRISLKMFCLLAFFLFIPTTINETKGTFVLLPFVFVIPLVINRRVQTSKIRTLLFTIVFFSLLLLIFTVVYNHFRGGAEGTEFDVIHFFLSDEILNSFYKGSAGKSYEYDTVHNIGRADAVIVAHQKLSSTLTTYLFGLGIGNTSISFYESLQGEHAENAEKYRATRTTLSYQLWEVGLTGFLLFWGLLVCILIDSYRLKDVNTLFGCFGAGWVTVTSIIILSIMYKSIVANDIFMLFWYFSGIIANKSYSYRMSKNTLQDIPVIIAMESL